MGLLADGPLFHRVLEQRHVEVATVTPDLSLLDIDGGGEAQCALAAWKGTDTSGAALLLAVKPLEPVGRTDAHPVRFGEGVELCSRGEALLEAAQRLGDLARSGCSCPRRMRSPRAISRTRHRNWIFVEHQQDSPVNDSYRAGRPTKS